MDLRALIRRSTSGMAFDGQSASLNLREGLPEGALASLGGILVFNTGDWHDSWDCVGRG